MKSRYTRKQIEDIGRAISSIRIDGEAVFTVRDEGIVNGLSLRVDNGRTVDILEFEYTWEDQQFYNAVKEQ